MNLIDGNNASLFGSMEDNSTVKHDIVAASTFRGHNAAPIAGFTNSTASVEDCHVLKDVTVEAITGNAGGVVANVYDGSTVKHPTSQAAVKGKVYAGGIAGYMVGGNIIGCTYLGNSVACGEGQLTKAAAILGIKSALAEEKVEGCYYTASTLTDEYSTLMPTIKEDNTNFLNLLHARDEFLLGSNNGLTEEQIGYELALNGIEYKAVLKDDNTWSSRAFTLCLPFDMSIPDALHEDVRVYQLHEIDLEKKEFIFTNDFPILKAGWPYILVVNKGSIAFSAKNTLVKETPAEPETVRVAGGSKELGYWRGTFETLDNERLVKENAYIMQRNGTYRHIDKIYSTQPKVARYLAYFSAIEPIGTSFKMKFVRLENGVETGEVTDFPADEFYSEYDIDELTGVREVQESKGLRDQDVQRGTTYNLSGQRVENGYKGIIIKNGKRIINY